MAKTKNAAEAVQYAIDNDPALAAEIEEHAFNAQVAELILNARESAGLTQVELAKLINSQQSVIARLEDWDYEGHSLTILKRIATALGQRLHVEFRPRFVDQKLTSPAASQKQVSSSKISGHAWAEICNWNPKISDPTINGVAADDIYGAAA